MTTEKPRDWSARRRVGLPAELGEPFRAICKRHGHVGSTLVYSAIIQAARLAKEGRTDMLPARSSAPTTLGAQVALDYQQNSCEAAQVAALLKAAGSSVRAVVAAWVAAYVAADGDLLELSWPRRDNAQAA